MEAETLDRVVTTHIRARHSCRSYRPDPLPRELVRTLLETAGRTPSWCNIQPWSVTVADAATTDELRSFLTDRVAQAAVGVARHDREARALQGWVNFRFFDAAHVVPVTVDRSVGPYALVDVGAWAAMFQLAATAHGLGCITQAAPTAHSSLLREFFRVPATHDVVCAVAFGLPDPAHAINGFRTTRAEHEETVQWRWDQ